MEQCIKQFVELKEKFESNGLDKIYFSLCKGSENSFNAETKKNETRLCGSEYVTLKFDLDIIDLFIEAYDKTTDELAFETKLNEYFNLEPHEFLILSKRIHKNNTLGIHCESSQCKDCLNFILCNQPKIKLQMILELNPYFLNFKFRKIDEEDPFSESNEFDKGGLKKKQNNLLNLLISKLFYKMAVKEAYRPNIYIPKKKKK